MDIAQQSPSHSITCPLGDSVYLHSMEGVEYMSGLFRFDLTLVSDDHDLDLKKVVGKNATVGLKLADDSERYIDGIVTHFSHAGQGPHGIHYHAVLQPWLWQLTLASDCRIYQQKSVPEIIEALFGELGFSDFKKDLKGSYDKRDYCVQYMETCFDFVSRLMEEEGIFYFFTFEKGKHTMVLADDPGAHKDCKGNAKAKFRNNPDEQGRYGTIPHCAFREGMTTGGFAFNDYNFEKPSEKLLAEAAGKGSDMKLYQYPGGYIVKGSGDSKAKRFQEACEAPGAELAGVSYAPGFTAGGKFTLEEHPRKALNAAYVFKSVRHSATGTTYSNGFTAIPADKAFRPPVITPRARVFGAQTAQVVGKSGEEIWTDKYGRIKVQFHWDREGKKDENSSCWVRVAQGWAGKKWGAFFLPRIGQEVIISFLDGDPDRPLVTGSVYNGEQTVPYGLPDNQTQSTIKSNTSKGGGGFNELRFEDKKDKEEIFIHAQKDMNTEVRNDQTLLVDKNRTTTIKEGTDKYTLEKGDRLSEVQDGLESHKVKKTRSIEVEGDEDHTNKANFTHEVKGDYTLKVTGNLTIQVTGDIKIDGKKNINSKSGMATKMESGTDFGIKAGTNLKAEAGVNADVKAGVNLKMEGGVNVESKAGVQHKSQGTMMEAKASAMQTVEGGAMTMVKGAMVMIN